ncbi:MAG: type I methionyl aminopeptidase [Bacteroidota bacterium]
MVAIKTEEEIGLMRESCRIVAEVLNLIGSYVKPGVTTAELDAIVEDYIRSCGGEPAFKGYSPNGSTPFPATICVSIDEEVVHGIPGKRVLNDGEIVSIDVGVLKNKFYGDGAWTFAVGQITEEKARLLRVTEESLYKGIAQAVEGNFLGDVSYSIQTHVEHEGFSVVRELVGHGIGRNLHEEPAVPNFGKAGTGIRLTERLTIAIEPMVNYGKYPVDVASDGWTVVTRDRKPSAHFEHTVVVRKGAAEILTRTAL